MAVTFKRYLEYIGQNKIREVRAKVELLRYSDESVRDTITGDVLNGDGRLDIVNKNGVRRHVRFTLINLDKKYLPNPDTFEIRQKIKVWIGLKIDEEDIFFPQGVFVVQNPSAMSTSNGNTMSITAIDKFCLANGTMGGETDGIYSIPVGTSLPDAIRNVLSPSTDIEREIFYDPIEPNIDTAFDSETTPYPIELSNGQAIGEILFQLANMVSANVYYDTNGRLIFESDIDDNKKGSQWDFDANSTKDYSYISNQRNYLTDKVFNAVLVIGSNINGAIYDAIAENNNLLSETSIPNVGYKRVYKVSDPNIYTDALALTRAKYELKRVTNLQSENDVSSVPMYHLDVDNIITISDDNLDIFRERNVINSLSIPLSTKGTMSVACAKSIDLILSE